MNSGNRSSALADEIHGAIEEAYIQLQPVCKPVVRSNNVREWTVLAGIVAVSQGSNGNELRVISIATGVKSLPDIELRRSRGKMLHDCHAEVLAMRGLNRVLLQHVHFLKRADEIETDLIVRYPSEEKFCLKRKWNLALYVSALPCGDSSMSTLRNEDDESQTVVIGRNDIIQYVDAENKTILRGRMNYERSGVVRTKPGRIDSKITLSKSCSDKLCMKQVTSALNCLTWSLFSEPIFLSYMIVPLKDVSQEISLLQSFHERIGNTNRFPIKIIECSKRFVDDKINNQQEPSPIASIKLFFNLQNQEITEQAILNGLRYGFYTKGNRILRKNCESIISRYSQWRLFQEISPHTSIGKTYLEFKFFQERRREIIEETRKLLSPDGWISTWTDDVLLD